MAVLVSPFSFQAKVFKTIIQVPKQDQHIKTEVGHLFKSLTFKQLSIKISVPHPKQFILNLIFLKRQDPHMLDTSGLKSKMEPGQENNTLYMLRLPSSLLFKARKAYKLPGALHTFSVKCTVLQSPRSRRVLFKASANSTQLSLYKFRQYWLVPLSYQSIHKRKTTRLYILFTFIFRF